MRLLWAAVGCLMVCVAAACGDSPGEPETTVGTLRVTNTATGPIAPGPDYFSLQAGPTEFVGSVDFNSTVVIDSLPTGPLSLDVDLGRSHCTVPTDPVTVAISAADTATVHLAITCVVNWGHLEVGLPATGPDQPALLTITLDGVAIGGAAPNTAGLGFPFIPAGAHEIGLLGLGTNCVAAEPNPQTVNIPLDDTVRIAFTITCT